MSSNIGKKVYLKEDFEIFDEFDWVLFLAGSHGIIVRDYQDFYVVEMENGDTIDLSYDKVEFMDTQ